MKLSRVSSFTMSCQRNCFLLILLPLFGSSQASWGQPSPGRIFSPINLAFRVDEAPIAVVKWLAFGSGCRTVAEVMSEQRDVEILFQPHNKVEIPRLTMELSFPRFSLANGKKVEKAKETELYSECALRFAIKGQPGRRVSRVEATSQFDVKKDKDAELTLINELRFGQLGSDERKIFYPSKSSIHAPLPLQLAHDVAKSTPEGLSSCGSDQVLFYDFTVFAKTKSSARAYASFSPPKRASITLAYESC